VSKAIVANRSVEEPAVYLARSASRRDHKRRLLAFGDDLLGELEALDLDTIDGEFYWRWCKADLLESLSVLPALPRPVGVPARSRDARLPESEDALSIPFEPEGLFDYLREGLRFTQDLLVFSDQIAQRYPRIVWQRLLEGERVAMRAAEAEVRINDLDSSHNRTLRLKVFSGAWTGKQVEEEVRRLAVTARLADTSSIVTARGAIALNIGFAFVDEAQARGEAFGNEPLRYPYVLVEVPLPLPPEHTIQREYDALVRQECGWHLELPGSGSRQEMVVALRTWTVGLLVYDGTAVNDAIDEVHTQLKLGDITQSCFGLDRKRLLERVPEAAPYLYAPYLSSDSDTREQRTGALVSGDYAPLPGQPSEPEHDLYP
jgi:hypothetical protein